MRLCAKTWDAGVSLKVTAVFRLQPGKGTVIPVNHPGECDPSDCRRNCPALGVKNNTLVTSDLLGKGNVLARCLGKYNSGTHE